VLVVEDERRRMPEAAPAGGERVCAHGVLDGEAGYDTPAEVVGSALMRSTPSSASPSAAERVPSTVTVGKGRQAKGRLKKASMVVVAEMG
jgi:hypothetical protein